jgi:hypothetical protein
MQSGAKDYGLPSVSAAGKSVWARNSSPKGESMSLLPRLTAQDLAMLASPVEHVERQGKQIRSDHKGGGVFFWWLLRPEDLVQEGPYEAGQWVVIANWGPFMPREGYPMEEACIPAEVRNCQLSNGAAHE